MAGMDSKEFCDVSPHALHKRIVALEQRCADLARALIISATVVADMKQRISDLERVVASVGAMGSREWQGTGQPSWWLRVVEGKPIRFVFSGYPSGPCPSLNIKVEPREP